MLTSHQGPTKHLPRPHGTSQSNQFVLAFTLNLGLPGQELFPNQKLFSPQNVAENPMGHPVPKRLEIPTNRIINMNIPIITRALNSSLVLGHEAGPDLDLHADLEHALEDAAARDAALEVVHLRAGLVDVERADDDEVRLRREVPHRNGDLLLDVLAHHLDRVLEEGHDLRPV